tara:strand:+ start:6242 stop:7012 length:771 start_codon:yes stop_codon:yes gene_type:complete
MNIENWNELTDEQKELAKSQMNHLQDENKKSIEFFEKKKYLIVKNVVDKNMCDFLYQYIKNEALRADYIDNKFGKDNYNEFIYGYFGDKQCPGDFSRYGDLVFDTLTESIKDIFSDKVGKKLMTTYSYHRLYTTGSELKKHKDRKSCDISGTLCIGYDISNLDDKNFNWPMFVEDAEGNQTPVYLNPGDAVLYGGSELYHWREPFLGKNHAQVFLHYNEDTKENQVLKNDGRFCLGLGADFRSDEFFEVTQKTYGE